MFEKHVEKGSTFSRTMSNIGKLGAYYTDVNMCQRIGHLIKWSEEVNIIEPSIGDASAISAVVGENNEGANVYGVELNEESYNALRRQMEEGTTCVKYLLKADFLHGVKISQKSFSFCFANPPYGDAEPGLRYEQAFEEKLFSYLKKGSLLVYVIPFYMLTDSRFVKSFYARYFPTGIYKFDDEVYRLFKQIVIFAYRREAIGYLKDDLEKWLLRYESVENIPYLPDINEDVEKYEVPTSQNEQVQYFTTLRFDAEAFRGALKKTTLLMRVGENGCVKRYTPIMAGSPPLPLTKETSHMLGVCGAGSGIAGNEDEGTLHLQRGVVDNITTTNIEVDEETGKSKLIETSSSATSLHIIDAEFNYYVLDK